MTPSKFPAFLLVFLLLGLTGLSFGQALDKATLVKFDHRIIHNESTWRSRVMLSGKGSCVEGTPTLSVAVSPDRVPVMVTKGKVRCKTIPGATEHFEIVTNTGKATLLAQGKQVKIMETGDVNPVGPAIESTWSEELLAQPSGKSAKPDVEPTVEHKAWTALQPQKQEDWYGAYEQAGAQFSNPFHILPIDGKITTYKQQFSDGIDNQNPPETIRLEKFSISGNRFSSKNWEGQMVNYDLNFHAKSSEPFIRPGLLVTRKGESEPVFFKRQEVSVLASSFLREEKKSLARYWPDNVLQSFTNPVWAEGAKGSGVGEWLRFTFATPRKVKAIRLLNGYTRSSQLFKKNGRVKSFTGTTSSGKRFTLQVADTMQEQVFPLDIAEDLTWITLEIKSIYKGSKYEDTCISNVDFDTIE